MAKWTGNFPLTFIDAASQGLAAASSGIGHNAWMRTWQPAARIAANIAAGPLASLPPYLRAAPIAAIFNFLRGKFADGVAQLAAADASTQLILAGGESNPTNITIAVMTLASALDGAAIEGGTITALCGFRFPPIRDPQRFPVCPKCKELAAMLWGEA